MHDLNDPRNQIDQNVVESPEMLGKECKSCAKVLAYTFFKRDSSFTDGRRDQCESCESSPCLSLTEHTARMRELNMNSEAVKAQRRPYQEDYKGLESRVGHPMTGVQFLNKLKTVVPNLYWQDGRIVGDLAVYLTYPCPQERLNGRDFEYLWFVEQGNMPEYSIYEFNDRDVMVREKRRGWRTPLLRSIKNGLISENRSYRLFGVPDGPASTVWYRTLYLWRNPEN